MATSSAAAHMPALTAVWRARARQTHSPGEREPGLVAGEPRATGRPTDECVHALCAYKFRLRQLLPCTGRGTGAAHTMYTRTSTRKVLVQGSLVLGRGGAQGPPWRGCPHVCRRPQSPGPVGPLNRPLS